MAALLMLTATTALMIAGCKPSAIRAEPDRPQAAPSTEAGTRRSEQSEQENASRAHGQLPASAAPTSASAGHGQPKQTHVATVTSADAPSSGSLIVSGRVLLPNGKPASRAQLELVSYDEGPRFAGQILGEGKPLASGIANEAGEYKLDAPGAGFYVLRASHEAAARTAVAFRDQSSVSGSPVIASGNEGVPNVKLDVILPTSATLAGAVVADGNKPVAGATVRAVQPVRIKGSYSNASVSSYAKTDVSGRFSIAGLAPGDVSLAVTAPAFSATLTKTRIPSTSVTVAMSNRGGSIDGGVYLLANGEPVTSATVYLEPQLKDEKLAAVADAGVLRTTTEGGGTFHFEQVPPGNYLYRAEKDNLQSAPLDHPAFPLVKVSAGSTTSGLEIFLYPGHSVSGVVVDGATKKPIPDATVRLFLDQNNPVQTSGAVKELETAADGKFRFLNVQTKWRYVRLRAEKDGYRQHSRLSAEDLARGPDSGYESFGLDPRNLDATCTITMQRTVKVSGVVKRVARAAAKPGRAAPPTMSADEGQPVAGAIIKCYDPSAFAFPPKPVATNANGEFELEAPGYSRVTLQAEAPGLPTKANQVVVTRDEPVTSVLVLMEEGRAVRGTVVDTKGDPLAGALVTAGASGMGGDDLTATADEQGKFGFDAVGPNSWFRASYPGYSTLKTIHISDVASGRGADPLALLTRGATDSAQGSVVSASDKEVEIRLVMQPAGSISGHVFDEAGQPIEGVNLTATSAGAPSGSAQTSEDGAFSIDGLTSGTKFSLVARVGGYEDLIRRNIASGTENLALRMKPSPLSEFQGHVISKKDKTAVPDFKVTFSGGAVSKRTKESREGSSVGFFAIKNVTSGADLKVVVSAPGFAQSEYTTQVPDTTADIGKGSFFHVFTLAEGGDITGRVVDKETKKPLAGVTILLKGQMYRNQFSRGEDAQQRTTTGADGKFRLMDVAGGTSTVYFSAGTPYADFATEINFDAGIERDLGDIALSRGSTVRGKVVRAPGDRGAGGVQVVLNDAQDRSGGTFNGSQQTTTDSDGKFEFPGLSNGNYVLNLPQQNVSTFLAVEAYQDVDVTLRIGSVTLLAKLRMGGDPVLGSVSLSQGAYSARTSINKNTDGKGIAKFPNLAPGTYNVRAYGAPQKQTGKILASLLGGTSDMQQNFRGMEDTVTIPEDAADTEIEKVFDFPSNRLTGRVVDDKGNGVQGASVNVRTITPTSSWDAVLPQDYNGARGMSTGRDGSFTFEGLNPGSYVLNATSQDGKQTAKSGIVDLPKTGEATAVELRLGTLQNGTVVSTALSMASGRGVKPAWCILWSETGEKLNNSAERDDDGVMTIRDVPAGRYKMQVSSFGFSVSERQIEVKPNEVLKVEDVLYDAGAVRLAVQLKDGSPAPNAQCTLTPDDPNSIEQPRKGTTDKNGLWVVRGLYPGSYTGTATITGSNATGKVTVIAHQPSDLAIRMP